MDTFLILVKLLCAHLCSDFILQTDGINDGKRKPGIKGISYQLLHSAIHAGVAYLLVAEWTCWLIPSVIFASHFMIDLMKCKLFSERSLTTFLADQSCHIAVILSLWYTLFGERAELECIKDLDPATIWVLNKTDGF